MTSFPESIRPERIRQTGRLINQPGFFAQEVWSQKILLKINIGIRMQLLFHDAYLQQWMIVPTPCKFNEPETHRRFPLWNATKTP
jgi:hypothetical protein